MNFYSKQKRYLGDMCLLNFKLNSSILLAALTSISLQAQEYEVEDTEPEQTQSEVLRTQVSEPVNARISDQVLVESHSPACPTDFYTLPVYPNAKFCQLFAEELPASMSYFSIGDQQTTKAFYIEKLGPAEDEKMLKGRIVLQYSGGQKVVVISKDGQGSQIDILIKSAD